MRDDAALLVDFMTASEWPFHGGRTEVARAVAARVEAGHYDADGSRTFWIARAGHPVGLIRLFDLGDDTPMFDLRIAFDHRGQGLGRAALAWLTEYVFTEFPDVVRIEGTTRQDNVAMRRVFRACGYVKEAHYRSAWPDEHGQRRDAVGYAVIRTDWVNGTVTAPNWSDEPAP